MRILLVALAGCVGLQSVPPGSKPGGEGHDPNEGVDSGEPIDTSGDANQEPLADAGGDLSGQVGMVANLDGSSSYDPDGDSLDYSWTLDSAPSGSHVKISDANKETAQIVPDVEGAYEISLVVSDGVLESEPDSITLTASTSNGKPVANAGPDQTVNVGDTVTLDGTGSSDPDGDPLQYSWTLATRPSGSAASLSSSTAARPSFVADVSGTYGASLTVSDGTEASGSDNVRVNAASSGGGGGGSSSSCGCQSQTASGGAGFGFILAIGASAASVSARRRSLRRQQ